MASRRRLLFADGNRTGDGNFNFDGNATIDCIANCIGICIYAVCFPDSPSPASLPNDGTFGNTSIPISLQKQDRLTPTLIITSISVVASCFALLLILYACLRHRRRARRNNRRQESETTYDSSNAIAEYSGGADAPPGNDIEHHVWFIRTQGLDDSTIASITSWAYKSSDPLIEGRDCSVCLGEFCDDELVRLLPKCSHAFHLSCIDKWLRSHVNCPLCRAPVISPGATTVPTPLASPAALIVSESSEPITEFSAPLENTQIEALPLEDGGDMTVIHSFEGSFSPPLIAELHPVSSEEVNVQVIRRSFSMDTFILEEIARHGTGHDELHEEDGMASSNSEKIRGSLQRTLRLKLRTKMERSLSSRSASWLLSRYGRPRNSVLPL